MNTSKLFIVKIATAIVILIGLAAEVSTLNHRSGLKANPPGLLTILDPILNLIVLHWHNLLLVLSAHAIIVSSPGPSLLMVINIAISQGRRQAILTSTGAISGNIIGGIAVATGVVAAFKSSATLFAFLKVVFGLYFLYLAFKYLRSALSTRSAINQNRAVSKSCSHHFLKGLLVTLSNPQIVISWIITFSTARKITYHPQLFTVLIFFCAIVTIIVYVSYAMLFSTTKFADVYARMQRPFDLALGLLVGTVAVRILTS